MKAYLYQADVLCEKCAVDEMIRLTGGDSSLGLFMSGAMGNLPSKREDTDHWPQGPYADGGGEADTPQHCGHCQLFLENPLTMDGVSYVQEQIYVGDGDQEVLREWHDYYWSVMDFPVEDPNPMRE